MDWLQILTLLLALFIQTTPNKIHSQVISEKEWKSQANQLNFIAFSEESDYKIKIQNTLDTTHGSCKNLIY